MTSIFKVKILILSRDVEDFFLSLNELEEKSQVTIILGKFVNKP